MDDTTELVALNISADANRDLYLRATIATDLLERFPYPGGSTRYEKMWERITTDEFTCLCPITRQPDYASIEVSYAPETWCVESKSLKLYLGSFRQVGTFHESVALRIAKDLQELLIPKWLLVVGRFAPRGGIAFRPRASYGMVPDSLLFRE